jgi:hypothetical protein
MPKRISSAKSPRRPADINQIAFQLVRDSTEDRQPEALPKRAPVSKAVSRIMAQMGSRGGKIGGKMRLLKMTPEQRSQVASDAAKARWAKKKSKSA